MFRSDAHFLMLCNLRFLEIQNLLIKRFNIFKNEEIKILKKNNTKIILYEWAKYLTEENKNTDIKNIPLNVLCNKKVHDIIKNDIDCRWLINMINVVKIEKEKKKISKNEFNYIDKLHLNNYPNVFYYEYPQYPYNYFEKKKMTNFFSLIKFPYNDILNISKKVTDISFYGTCRNKEIDKCNDTNDNDKDSDFKKSSDNDMESDFKKSSDNDKESYFKKSNDNDKENDKQFDEHNINYTSSNYVYAPSEMETSKENYH
ncbi:conserved Plasmodium protein, unknown function [Plasmodium ovale]|nr:conserved Plasmodium protein, unknown function [Plasmodium ovale]